MQTKNPNTNENNNNQNTAEFKAKELIFFLKSRHTHIKTNKTKQLIDHKMLY